MNPDAPIPPELVSVSFIDGKLAGTSVMVDNQTCHHWATRDEYYERFSEAPDGVLKSYFRIMREGYRAVKPTESKA